MKKNEKMTKKTAKTTDCMDCAKSCAGEKSGTAKRSSAKSTKA